jgi:sugar lactone lactonase YvrE
VLSSDTERGSHLAIGPDRSVWVSEPEGRRVSRFTFDGTPSGVVDQTRAGRLLRLPVGIAVGPDGTLYVADASLRAVVALSFWP